MRLISLNTWGGIVYEPLISFIKKYADSTDIFCFQEVHDSTSAPADDPRERPNLLSELQRVLSGYESYFSSKTSGSGLATFVRKDIPIADTETFTVLSTEEMAIKFNSRILQHGALKEPQIHIYNFHGVPKSDKLDTPERKIQTDRVLEILSRASGPKILVGDFNLRPETESLRAFEKNMRNLVTESNCKTTRSSLYEYKELQPFADYAFVDDVAVQHFDVLQDEVSDHLPLLLDFQ